MLYGAVHYSISCGIEMVQYSTVRYSYTRRRKSILRLRLRSTSTSASAFYDDSEREREREWSVRDSRSIQTCQRPPIHASSTRNAHCIAAPLPERETYTYIYIQRWYRYRYYHSFPFSRFLLSLFSLSLFPFLAPSFAVSHSSLYSTGPLTNFRAPSYRMTYLLRCPLPCG